MLTGSAYADDRRLRSRMAIWAYAETRLRSLESLRQSGRLSLVQADAVRIPLPDASVDVALAMPMLYHVPDVAAAIRELHRITRPSGTVLASTNSAGSLAGLHDLLDEAISRRLGRPVQAMADLSCTTQTGTALLSQEFADVTLRTHDVPLSIPSAQPIVAYLGSIREPVLARIGEPLDFDAAQGSFRAISRSGAFICR